MFSEYDLISIISPLAESPTDRFSRLGYRSSGGFHIASANPEADPGPQLFPLALSIDAGAFKLDAKDINGLSGTTKSLFRDIISSLNLFLSRSVLRGERKAGRWLPPPLSPDQ